MLRGCSIARRSHNGRDLARRARWLLNMMTQAAIKNNFHMTKLITNKYVTLASHGAPPLRDSINAKDVYGNTSMHYYGLRTSWQQGRD